MIKDIITPELKLAFLEAIKKSRKIGKETGFFICKNENLFPSKICTGNECGFVLKNPSKYCPDKVQGGFHTHPYIPNIEQFYGRKATEKDIEEATILYEKHFKRKGISLQTPSHHDIVDTIIEQCIGETEGTVCVGTDLDLNKVECWTVRSDKVKINDCSRAHGEHKQRISDEPRKWVKPLFTKEVIQL